MNFRKSIFKFWSIAAAVGIAAACTNVDAEDIDLVKLGALEKEFIVEADANSFDIDIYTNGAYHIERINESDWLNLACGETTDGKATITAECEFNEDFKRKAGIVLCSDVDSRRDTLYIKQKALIDARIAFANSSIIVPGAGGENKSVIETNVPFSDITVETEYSDPENTDWIQEIEIVDAESEERELVITLDANPAEEVPRSAAVSLSFTDGWDETVSVEFNLLQRTAKETLGRNITFEEFRQNYALNKKIEDYVIIEGIVVSNPDNRNAGENTQLTTSTIDYTVSERTLYLESKDGRYGIAILTNEVEDNIFDQYDHVQLLIQGATGNLVENPDRYELEGVTKSMVISRTAGSASDVPIKEKHMNELTDDDIYTYVTLKEVEFPVRKGSITPVNEGYAIGTNAHRISKYPLLVRDINGDAMYMMTNTNCAYRSDGTRLPYGSGDISGVIVHERFSRFEWRNGADPAEMTDDPTLGYIGRYQIRHQNKEDIWGKMQNSVEDSFSALLTEYRYWNPDTENEVQKPTYGTNGWLTHTYQEKYSGSASKEYLQATYKQHMVGGGTGRFYAWLINFSTEGISTSHISMQISVMNTQQTFYSPRYWCAEWALTDSQAPEDDSQWNLIGEYTVPDVSVWSNTLYSSIVAYKYIDFELPQEILGHPDVYIRLRPTSDLCSDGSDYANARLNGSAAGAALASQHASSLEYFAIRYNK